MFPKAAIISSNLPNYNVVKLEISNMRKTGNILSTWKFNSILIKTSESRNFKKEIKTCLGTDINKNTTNRVGDLDQW